MGIFSRNEKDEYLSDDYLIIFDNDKKTSDVAQITEITEDTVKVQGVYAVPLEDCEITNGRLGRNFFYRAPTQSVTETKRLAQLEFNTVLKQVTAYKPPVLPSSMDWTKGLLFGALIIAIIVMAFV